MDLKKSKRLLLILAAVYWVFVIGIYAIAYEQFPLFPAMRLRRNSLLMNLLTAWNLRRSVQHLLNC